MVQTAEGGLEEAANIAQRMRELAVQGGNDTLSSADRDKIKGEMDQLQKEMQNIADETTFNGNKLLDGSNTNGFTIQAGANAEVRTIETADLSSIANDLSKLDISDNANAQTSIQTIEKALEDITSARADLGAMQNRLDYTSSNLNTSDENLTAAESRIRDVDVAKEMVKLSKLNILTQASQAMVSQAKQQPEQVTQLLR